MSRSKGQYRAANSIVPTSTIHSLQAPAFAPAFPPCSRHQRFQEATRCNCDASSRTNELEAQLKTLQGKHADLEATKRKDEEYVRATVEGYAKLGDEIYHLKKRIAWLQAEIEKKDATVRSLRRKAEIDEESREQHLNLTVLQMAIKFDSCTSGGRKKEIERLQGLVAGRSTHRRIWTSTSNLDTMPPDQKIPPSPPSVIKHRLEFGARSPPSPGNPRHAKQQGGNGEQLDGRVHRLNSAPQPPRQASTSRQVQRHQSHHERHHREHQKQRHQNQHEKHLNHQHRSRPSEGPYTDLCPVFLQSGECPGCSRNHNWKDYPSHTKGYQVGVEHEEKRGRHSYASKSMSSADLQASTATPTSTVSPGEKKAQSNHEDQPIPKKRNTKERRRSEEGRG
ncbi:hypothetical protein TWF481_009887 [Arthrobotrys musiformis]|uniref:Uncharacterized protein n=1 Tax=Arthrobotrys musiformis TaxID=47236 RepID=A0AAV9W593_9PEZI